jgi:cell division protein ZapB
MDIDLASLEDKVRQVSELCSRLRTENRELRERLAALEAERLRLTDKVDGAKLRLEALLQQIPE